MLKVKYLLLATAISLCVSGCGIFKKDCGCPKFGKVKTSDSPMAVIA